MIMMIFKTNSHQGTFISFSLKKVMVLECGMNMVGCLVDDGVW